MSEFKSITFTDSEAGLFSFAQMNHLMKVEFARARRYRLPLAFVVFVVDRLSDLSKNFGYKARDLVLERFQSVLRRETRSCDFVGRFTDDRVLLLLPHTDAEGARVLVNRVRRIVAMQEFEFEGKAFRVTISAGISQYRDGNTLFFDTVRDAAEMAAQRAAAIGDHVMYMDSAQASPPGDRNAGPG
ncbi:MAG: GGDEF domain-containing protein [Planctomycetes bacterium]|nr:GGDEF domain-containing protein [Planctomycetota bacterium]